MRLEQKSPNARIAWKIAILISLAMAKALEVLALARKQKDS